MTPQEADCFGTFLLLSIINMLAVVIVLSLYQLVVYGSNSFKEYFLPYKVFFPISSECKSEPMPLEGIKVGLLNIFICCIEIIILDYFKILI